MSASTKTYLVVSALPVVVEDGGISISYQPGAVFEALTSNPSVVRLLGIEQIIETTGPSSTGTTVIQGPIGPIGPVGPIGPIGPNGGLLVALVIDPTTGGNDIEMTDADNIIGQSDGGWGIGTPDAGATLLRPDTIYVKTSIIIGDTVTVNTGAVTGSAALLVISGAATDLSLSGGDAVALSNDNGGAVVLTAGAKNGIGTDGKIEFRGNYANPLVMDVDGAVNLYDTSANKVIELLADPGALRVGRNTALTAAEGDFIFGNDATLTGVQTGILFWDASTSELVLRDNTANRMMLIGGASNELAIYGSTGIRGLKATVNGGTAEFRAEDAADRTGVDAVLSVLLRGGNADGVENGGVLTLEAGRALGSGTDGELRLRTGNTDRWIVGPTGHLVAGVDNTYDIGASAATRPRTVFIGTSGVVAEGGTSAVTIGDGAITATVGLGLTAGAAGDLDLAARGSTAIPFNEVGHLAFTGTVAGFSVVRAVNTIETAGTPDLATVLGLGNTTGANDILIAAGQELTAAPGDSLSISCTDPAGDTVPGTVTISAGNANGPTNNDGGDVTLLPGNENGAGNPGRILLTSSGTSYPLTDATTSGPALTTTAQTLVEAINELDVATATDSDNHIIANQVFR
jgi:hypothetical protein